MSRGSESQQQRTPEQQRAAEAFALLMPGEPDKDSKHRLNHYIRWLYATGRNWAQVDLAAHRDYLLEICELSPSSVSAHLATIRARYRAVLRDPNTRAELYSRTPQDAPPADRKAYVDEVYERIRAQLEPGAAPVSTTTHQDRPDSQHLRLTVIQARNLMQQPGIDSLRGLRDTAMLALFLCTGIREAELCGLNVEDLRQTMDGELALYVREGKGRKRRLVPYGELDWVLVYVNRWLENAGIESGAVFRGFYKGNKRLRQTRISQRTINYILNQYPISIKGEVYTVQPHDLRRTYARQLYEAGVDLNRIRLNLGHTNINTTLGYIGDLDAINRRPPSIFQPPHQLNRVMQA